MRPGGEPARPHSTACHETPPAWPPPPVSTSMEARAPSPGNHPAPRFVSRWPHGGSVGGLLLCRPLQVKTRQISAHRSCPNLPKHGGDLAAMICSMVHDVLQALNEKQGVRFSRNILVIEGLGQASL